MIQVYHTLLLSINPRLNIAFLVLGMDMRAKAKRRDYLM